MDAEGNSKGRYIPGWARWVVGLGLVGLLSDQLARRWGEFQAHPLTADPAWLALALATLLVANAVGCEAWRRWLPALGASLSYREAVWVLFQANVAKYLPGSAWHYVGRVVLCERRGVAPGHTALSILMDTGCHLATALMVAAVLLPLAGVRGPLEPLPAAAAAGLATLALLVGLHPAIANAVLGAIGRRFRREVPRITLGYGTILAMLGWYLLTWAIQAAGIACLAAALSPVPLTAIQVAALGGGLAAAWAVGALALFAPAGLGVREAGLALILAQVFPAGWALAFALATRLWFLAGEAVFCVIAWGIGPGDNPELAT